MFSFSGFYQMSQDQNEKKQMFSSCLKGTLNQFCSHFPTLIPEGDMVNQLKNQLFFGMHKTLGDSMCYLFNNNTITTISWWLQPKRLRGKPWKERELLRWKKQQLLEEEPSELNKMKKQLAVLKSMFSKNWNMVRQKGGPQGRESIKGI